MRAVAVVVALGSLAALALFFSIDHFVTQRFGALHDERVARQVEQVRTSAERELGQLRGTVALLAGDADLVNSTYYHRHLEGEREHPQAAVERIARAFAFESVSLWAPDGSLIAGTGVPLGPMLPTNAADQSNTRFHRHKNGVWIVATHLLFYNDHPLAILQIGRPLRTGIEPAAEFGAPSDLSSRKSVPVVLNDTSEPRIALYVPVPDTVADAVAGIKRVLGIVLATFGILLTAGLAIGLRRVFRPVLEVIDAALAVGRGEFHRRLTSSGTGGEVTRLVDAFNQMTDGLQRLRDLERKVQHQEQLSAIGRAAARVAHDLNNPLTVISTTADLTARRPDLDPALTADMQLIQHHSERARATIEALLDYGRPVRLRMSRVNLSETTGEIVRAWARRHPGLSVDFRSAQGPITAELDPLQIERMLENVLDNARSVAQRVSVSLAGSDGTARIAITDDGPGFSPDAQVHLFEPFFTTQTGGTGLGLASALAIARAHEGDIAVTPGPPTVVTITLPLADAEVQPKA
ncbi:MAG: HAMP domain-containing sensor histidine kinase [Hyphomicrobiaceae bacterium]|nr:HAMP domain-containing sensor histidine kinase [Hyphomicrobiaceae bacterium]